jgi:integrase
MGSVYTRHKKLWVAYVDSDGKRKWMRTPFSVGEEDKAHKLLKSIEGKIAVEKEHGVTPESGPMTVERYAEKWLKGREGTIETVADERIRLTLHVYPTLGEMPIADVRPRHVRDLVKHLKIKKSDRDKPLAPRTIHNVYGVLHRMMHDAQVDELIAANPCVLKRGDLPKKLDADPAWRQQAVFTREEIELLISHPSIPDDRRALYALIFLGAMRFGEAAALRWRHYDPTQQPLGRLLLEA